MINIKLLRDPNSLKQVADSEEKRFKDPKLVYECAELDQKKIKLMYELEQTQKQMNKLNKEIRDIIKASKNNSVDQQSSTTHKNGNKEKLIAKMTELKAQKETQERELNLVTEEFNSKFKTIGNVLDSRVPVTKNEDEATIMSEYTTDRVLTPKLQFSEIMEKLDCIDMKRGTKVSGHRGYFLLEGLALLENALVRYAIDFLRSQKYTFIQTPILINKEIMEKTCQLSDFEEQLFGTNDFFLCATSEQPISALYMNERLSDEDLPKKFAGQSLCFRKEAGAAGKDNKGIFRVHQFEKVEQFIICKPSESEDFHQEMINISIDFYKSLKISHRVITIVSGDMNDSAALKYDLEAHFPFTDNYRELVSASNCTDYQSRDLEIRYGFTKQEVTGQSDVNKKMEKLELADDKKEKETKQLEKSYVHMLNATLCAIQRTLCCIVENYQTETGVLVPEVLRPYMPEDCKEILSYKK